MNKKTKPIFSASLLAADWSRFGQEAKAIVDAGVEWLHIDVMDNHYVPNLSFGAELCRSLKKHGIKAPLDVHLMAKPVERLISDFAKAGATYITIHPDACEHVDRTVMSIKEQGCKAGIALNPATPLDCLDYVLEVVDMVLIMTVNPGFSGQKLMDRLLPKIAAVRKRIDHIRRPIHLQVDGGIQQDNIAAIAEAGADVFVMGSTLFHASDYGKMVTTLRGLVAV